jgi:RNA polymerase sigma factor (sigma-70 family)
MMPASIINELDHWFIQQVLPLEPLLVGFLRRNWRQQDDIDDLRQDIYVQVYEAAEAVRPAFVKAFVFTVARNLLIDRARRAKVVSIDSAADPDTVDSRIDELSPERHAIGRQDLFLLQHALAGLPPRCREVVELRKVVGLSQREVAERLGIAEATVEKQIAKGVRALAGALLAGGVQPAKKGEVA